MIGVMIPPHVLPGQPFVFQTPHGQQMVVQAPPGSQPGQVIQIAVPAQHEGTAVAVAPQAMQRAHPHEEQNI